ncbi:hypothetical protein ACIA8K_03720 [Catenuloplanes sp. NPDC051500]|uniref:hypothetical protein n=1 Tax=Catenuloplanes sp. NPDC051500 TaxID=3363959 RepID=UPI003794F822
MTARLALAIAVLAGTLFALVAAPAQAAPAATGKYYVVGTPANGQREYLYAIALKTLGDGNRSREIAQLNLGRTQPDGGALDDSGQIRPGWILMLPADAAGEGVKDGPLPAVQPVAAAPSRPTAPAPQGAAAPESSASVSIAILWFVGFVLILMLVAALINIMHNGARTAAAAAARDRARIAPGAGDPPLPPPPPGTPADHDVPEQVPDAGLDLVASAAPLHTPAAAPTDPRQVWGPPGANAAEPTHEFTNPVTPGVRYGSGGGFVPEGTPRPATDAGERSRPPLHQASAESDELPTVEMPRPETPAGPVRPPAFQAGQSAPPARPTEPAASGVAGSGAAASGAAGSGPSTSGPAARSPWQAAPEPPLETQRPAATPPAATPAPPPQPAAMSAPMTSSSVASSSVASSEAPPASWPAATPAPARPSTPEPATAVIPDSAAGLWRSPALAAASTASASTAAPALGPGGRAMVDVPLPGDPFGAPEPPAPRAEEQITAASSRAATSATPARPSSGGRKPTGPKPPLPEPGGADPVLNETVLADEGPAGVHLVGVSAGRSGPAYAWLAEGDVPLKGVIPLVIGRRNDWWLHVDLGRTPDCVSLAGTADAVRRQAALFARRLQQNGVGVFAVGSVLGEETVPGLLVLDRLPALPEPGAALPTPRVVFCADPDGTEAKAARDLTSATAGRLVPVFLGPAVSARWTIRIH